MTPNGTVTDPEDNSQTSMVRDTVANPLTTPRKNHYHNDDDSLNATSDKSLSEFSSFDISDDENQNLNLKRHQNVLNRSKNVNNYEIDRENQNDDKTNEINNTEGNNNAFMSTPRSVQGTNTSSSFEFNFFSPNTLDSHLNKSTIDGTRKGSSRISSDTFDTPKTIDTRASTMTSNGTNDCSKMINHNLLLSAATLRNQTHQSFNTTNSTSISQVSQDLENSLHKKSPAKRLSRQGNYDSLDQDIEYNASFNDKSLDDLFSKLSLNNESIFNKKSSLELIPSTTELIDLQNQLTNCKIQIKLQNDLLRETLFKHKNKDDLLNALETQIMNGIKSAKNDIQNNDDYNLLKLKYNNLLEENDRLTKSPPQSTDGYNDIKFNQNDIQDKINQLIMTIKNSMPQETSQNEFHGNDCLETLNFYIKQILAEITQNKKIIDTQAYTLSKNKSCTDELLKSIESYSKQIEELETSYRTKIDKIEVENKDYKVQLELFKDTIDFEKSKNFNLQSKYNELENKWFQLNAKVGEFNKNHNYSKQISNQFARMSSDMAKYHTMFLKLLTKVIDPASAGNIIDACKKFNSKTDVETITKLFSVAQNFEIESLSKILENYQKLLKQKKENEFNAKTISELYGEVHFLTKQINNLENTRDSETVKIRELEAHNKMLKEIANEKDDKMNKLKKLRIDDLVKKWKTAEEALSQTRKGAELKISQLEDEVKELRSQLNKGQ